MGNRAPVHRTIQNCCTYSQGVFPKQSAQLPIHGRHEAAVPHRTVALLFLVTRPYNNRKARNTATPHKSGKTDWRNAWPREQHLFDGGRHGRVADVPVDLGLEVAP